MRVDDLFNEIRLCVSRVRGNQACRLDASWPRCARISAHEFHEANWRVLLTCDGVSAARAERARALGGAPLPTSGTSVLEGHDPHWACV